MNLLDLLGKKWSLHSLRSAEWNVLYPTLPPLYDPLYPTPYLFQAKFILIF